jgi:dihydroorotase-like cyclic amidohydrolase
VLLRGGRVVTGPDVALGDVRVRDGRIAEVGVGLPVDGDRVVDLDGLHLLPGAIDPHGHQWEPGFTPSADFSEVTASAALGGVTTLLDHPLTPPIVSDEATFDAKAALGERTSIIDFGLHGGAAPDTIHALADLWARGATGIKVFTCRT